MPDGQQFHLPEEPGSERAPSIKSLKFVPELADMIRRAEKFTTWRLFDDKDLQLGDVIDLYELGYDRPFGRARVSSLVERPMGRLTDEDWEGHEKFESDEAMYATYSRYYGRPVGPETMIKVLRFELT